MRIRIAETDEIKELSYIYQDEDILSQIAEDDMIKSRVENEYMMFREDFKKWDKYITNRNKDITKLQWLCDKFNLDFQTEYEIIVGFAPNRESEHECFEIAIQDIINQNLIHEHDLVEIAKKMIGMKVTESIREDIVELFNSNFEVTIVSLNRTGVFEGQDGAHTAYEYIAGSTSSVMFTIENGIIVDAWI